MKDLLLLLAHLLTTIAKLLGPGAAVLRSSAVDLSNDEDISETTYSVADIQLQLLIGSTPDKKMR